MQFLVRDHMKLKVLLINLSIIVKSENHKDLKLNKKSILLVKFFRNRTWWI